MEVNYAYKGSTAVIENALQRIQQIQGQQEEEGE